MSRDDLERLKALAERADDDPSVTTLDAQIRTTRYVMFPNRNSQEAESDDKGTESGS